MISSATWRNQGPSEIDLSLHVCLKRYKFSTISWIAVWFSVLPIASQYHKRQKKVDRTFFNDGHSCLAQAQFSSFVPGPFIEGLASDGVIMVTARCSIKALVTKDRIHALSFDTGQYPCSITSLHQLTAIKGRNQWLITGSDLGTSNPRIRRALQF